MKVLLNAQELNSIKNDNPNHVCNFSLNSSSNNMRISTVSYF